MPLTGTERNMQLIRQLPDQSPRPSAVAIGNFDGLHQGHQAVIDAMKRAAKQHGLVASALTFEPHPRRFFAPNIAAFRIARVQDKIARLRDAGVERLVMPRFDQAFAQLSPEAFLDDVLGRRLGAKAVVTGENFSFGHKRRGDRAMLAAWGAANNVAITTLPPVMVDGRICSSSAIRVALTQGDMATATQLLGRPYSLTGRVVHGEKRGRTLGFPTANLPIARGLLAPAYGVYAIRAEIDGATYAGVANVGMRPTAGSYQHPIAEAHLFDTMQEIYGKTMKLSLLHFLRPEKKFDGLEALRAQIATDTAQARQWLKEQA
jgi:riboflavin kinase/FMN adenylyltransferase